MECEVAALRNPTTRVSGTILQALHTSADTMSVSSHPSGAVGRVQEHSGRLVRPLDLPMQVYTCVSGARTCRWECTVPELEVLSKAIWSEEMGPPRLASTSEPTIDSTLPAALPIASYMSSNDFYSQTKFLSVAVRPYAESPAQVVDAVDSLVPTVSGPVTPKLVLCLSDPDRPNMPEGPTAASARDARDGPASKQCLLCDKPVRENDARTHSAYHILYDCDKVRGHLGADPALTHLNPCGLCAAHIAGQKQIDESSFPGCTVWFEGSSTQAQHQCKLWGNPKYSMGCAAKISKASPSTNRPMRCPLCYDVKKPTVVWLYNMAGHYATSHHGKPLPILFEVSEAEKAMVETKCKPRKRKHAPTDDITDAAAEPMDGVVELEGPVSELV